MKTCCFWYIFVSWRSFLQEEVESAKSELEDFDVVVEEYETQFDDLETTLLAVAGIFTATGVSIASGLVNYHSKNYVSIPHLEAANGGVL